MCIRDRSTGECSTGSMADPFSRDGFTTVQAAPAFKDKDTLAKDFKHQNTSPAAVQSSPAPVSFAGVSQANPGGVNNYVAAHSERVHIPAAKEIATIPPSRPLEPEPTKSARGCGCSGCTVM
eukprot:TRINITY_DN4148_c0_g1_i2.p1 TRINITY_DN4148_c0_g1~~TRINITY_DN4148_c0_g1_i2.p1  ORF type:complete len:122 (+),score=14.83 TRINITY_DN4148_c0_g1_i2:91-456(+)